MPEEWRQAYKNATRTAKIKRFIIWQVRDLKHFAAKIKKTFTPGLLKQIERKENGNSKKE